VTDGHRTAGEEASNADLEAVYGWAVRHGVAEEGIDLNLSRQRVRQAVKELSELHLLQHAAASAELVPVSPQTAASSLLTELELRLLEDERDLLRRREEAAALRARIASFSSVYYEARVYQGDSAVLDVVDDGHAVRALLEQATVGCQSEVLACQPGGVRPATILDDALPRDLALLARGVRLRSLYQFAAQFDGPTIAYSRASTAAGSQIRIATELPPRMIIIDQAVAFLPYKQKPGGAVVVREPSIIAVLNSIFEQAWDNAQPFGHSTRSAVGEMDEMNVRILRLLAKGLTDKVISDRLGIAERTCRERVAALYRQLGAKSRFQAGVAAQASGLIDAPAEPHS
jgi:DNA-binding CsgD family transcriptional regulator